jgi:DNA-binding XRE family transcriptional regulator
MAITSEQDATAKEQISVELLLKLVAPNLMRKIRKALGLTQEQMANLVGVSRQMVNYYEQAYAYPSADTWVKWIDVVEKQIKKLRRSAKELEQG